MAISTPITSTAVAERESTWRTNLETPATGAHSIQMYRETVAVDESDEPVGAPKQNMTAVNRTFETVNDETADLASGSRVTFAEVVEALAQFGDRWAEEDAAKEEGGGAVGGEPAPA